MTEYIMRSSWQRKKSQTRYISVNLRDKLPKRVKRKDGGSKSEKKRWIGSKRRRI